MSTPKAPKASKTPKKPASKPTPPAADPIKRIPDWGAESAEGYEAATEKPGAIFGAFKFCLQRSLKGQATTKGDVYAHILAEYGGDATSRARTAGVQLPSMQGQEFGAKYAESVTPQGERGYKLDPAATLAQIVGRCVKDGKPDPTHPVAKRWRKLGGWPFPASAKETAALAALGIQIVAAGKKPAKKK